MPIKIGANPENEFGVNKFLGLGGEFGNEGHRGRLALLHRNGKRALVYALTKSLDPSDGVEANEFYLVEERDPTQWPHVVAKVDIDTPEPPAWWKWKEWKYVFDKTCLVDK
ncbi:MAG: hypothetical protein LC620_02030 [Halobacteriales archaeon]|nr:hypothetical protein [Halobacteriales archaeon]